HAELVDLVEHEERVVRTGRAEVLDDATGQGADVGAAVAADLGLVAHAAEREADELASHGAGDRAAEGRLTDAGRADEAKNGALAVLLELADGKMLEDAVLDLLEIEVILVEHLTGVQ